MGGRVPKCASGWVVLGVSSIALAACGRVGADDALTDLGNGGRAWLIGAGGAGNGLGGRADAGTTATSTPGAAPAADCDAIAVEQTCDAVLRSMRAE
jgi:hypothetical protein